MVGLGDWKFPIEFIAIEGNDVVVKWTQIIPGPVRTGPRTPSRPTRGSSMPATGASHYEEDIYNMVHVFEDLAASGWQPTEPMNLPPRSPNRDWSIPEKARLMQLSYLSSLTWASQLTSCVEARP